MTEWNHKIFTVDESGFLPLALEIFHFQYHGNRLYKTYCDAIGVDPSKVNSLQNIPFLPIGFFKTDDVFSGYIEPTIIFESSGTTQTVNSKHYVRDIELYRKSFSKAFELFYGDIKEYCILALLPSYLERKNSSLVMMTDELIKQSGHPQSGFYLYDHDKLRETIDQLESSKTKTILIGVSFALLDFSEKFRMELKHTIIMETGGMKGRREELTRPALHELLCNRFAVPVIHSEYGMTELLSQAYSKAGGLFHTPPWMKVLLRDEDDPLQVSLKGRGVLNIIDLANVHSCSFIATDDVGNLYDDGSFEMLGRMDNSDLRGCSLMVV